MNLHFSRIPGKQTKIHVIKEFIKSPKHYSLPASMTRYLEY